MCTCLLCVGGYGGQMSTSGDIPQEQSIQDFV